jgi:hypothetical protein
VLLTSRSEGRVPELREIRTQVEEDWIRDRKEKARVQALHELAGQYVIEYREGLSKK